MKTVLFTLFLITVSLICYYNTIFGNFVFDDIEAVVKNKDVLNETPLKNVFQNDFWGTPIHKNHSHKSYRPITILSFRLNNYFSLQTKSDPFYYHAVNIILYSILCVLCYFVTNIFFELVYNDSGSKKRAFLSCLLFTVHPIHVECVAAIVGRADLLCAIFYMISFLFYYFTIKATNYLKVIFFATAVIFAALSTFSKETGITVLGVCTIYDLYLNQDIWRDVCFTKFKQPFKSELKRMILRVTGLICALFLLLLFRLWIIKFQTPIFQKMDNPASFSPYLLTRILTYNYVYMLNLLLLIWPHWLCFDWAMGCIPLLTTFYDYRFIFVLTFWTFSFILIYQILKAHKRNLIIPVSLIIIPFLPASNIIRVGFVLAERTLLLPSIGFCMLVTIGFFKIKIKYPILSQILLTILITTFILKVHLRNKEWLVEETLYNSALNVCPNNAKVHYNIAKIMADRGNMEKAEKEYRTAISLHPEYDNAMNNLANILRDFGRLDEAERLLKRTLKIRPDFAAAWMNLGIVQMNKKQQKSAEVSFLNALKYRPKYADCYYNLGNLYLDQKKYNEAISSWKMAIQIKPLHALAWSNLLILLDSLGRTEEAILAGYQAVKLLPREPSIYFNLGNSLGKAKRWHEAEHNFQNAISLNPNNALYYSNLGVLYHRWNKLEEAENYYRIALRLDPDLKNARDNLKKLKSQ